MDPDTEVQIDSMPYFRIYKSGRMYWSDVIKLSPPSVDAATGVSSKDTVIHQHSGVSARLYIPTATENSPRRLPVVVYYHGGAFCVGSASSAPLHHYLNSLVARANVIVISVEYRLATEYPVPAAYEDSWLALRWVSSGTADEWLTDHADFGRVFVAGDSAGANIAHNVALRAGTESLPNEVCIEGLVLFHPYFLDVVSTESDAMDTRKSAGLKKLWKIVCPSSTGTDDPRINPVADGAPSLSGLGCGRVLVCVAEMDVLRDRGRAYYGRLRSCGWKGEVELYESRGEGHVFHVMKPDCEEAEALTMKICSFLNS